MASNKSDTETFCTCGWLERAAREPSSPIGFDERLQEYHIVHGRAYSILRFCPRCGFKTPKSRREPSSEVVPGAEMDRLQGMVRGIRTLDDARRVLGEPDDVVEPGGSSQTPESEGDPPRVTLSGTMFRWLNVSKSADVSVQIPAPADVSVVISPKPRRDSSNPAN